MSIWNTLSRRGRTELASNLLWLDYRLGTLVFIFYLALRPIQNLKHSWLSGALLSFALIATSAHSEVVLRVGSHLQARSSGVAGVIQPWLDAVQADVGAELSLQYYWGGSLGKHADKQYELVRSGVLDIGWIIPAYTAGQFPELGLFELPFFFASAEEAGTVGWQLHQQGLLTGLDGVRLIGVFTTEPNGLFLSKPVTALSAVENQKIRSLGAVHNDWLAMMNVAAQTMNPVDMNQALDRGILDGAIQGWSGMRTFDSFRLVEQAWQVPLGTTVFLILINEKSWQRLPARVKASMQRHGGLQIAKLGGRYFRQLNKDIHAELLADGRLSIRRPDAQSLERFARDADAVHRRWITQRRNGEAVYAKARQLIDAFRHTSGATDAN